MQAVDWETHTRAHLSRWTRPDGTVAWQTFYRGTPVCAELGSVFAALTEYTKLRRLHYSDLPAEPSVWDGDSAEWRSLGTYMELTS